MRIVMLHQKSYPHGMAITNRTHMFAKGFRAAGAEVLVLVPWPTETDSARSGNVQARGTHDGVPFEYACGATQRPDGFLRRRLLEVRGLWRTTAYLRRHRRDTAALVMVGDVLRQILFFRLVTWMLRIPYLHEKGEFPLVWLDLWFNLKGGRPGRGLRALRRIYTFLVCRSFDGVLVISHALRDYLAPRIKRSARQCLVPILVDMEEFPPRNGGPDAPHLVYCGTLSQWKDGALTLVEAFALLLEKVPAARLFLVGDTLSETNKSNLRKRIEDLGIADKIVLTGFVSRERLLDYLRNAAALVLAKPSGLQAETCFPSKIAEYLATGNPVVTTRVGEIPYYLEDGRDAYLAEPDNAASFAEKLERALSDGPESARIGAAGRATALEQFDYRLQARRVLEFIRTFHPIPHATTGGRS